ncbi:MAG: DUF1559 domain-containing protein [Abitibacteriaceae bacterium]|nr:DUF1559 domain-containing protein [Abditibacteriaceae bacterium]
MNPDRYTRITENVYIDRLGTPPSKPSPKPPPGWAKLLVTLVGMGVLAAILMPVFTCSHCGGGRRSICQSNLKQIGLGLMQYTQDNDERFPPVAINEVNAVSSGHAPQFYGWADAVQAYVKGLGAYHCATQLANQKEDEPRFKSLPLVSDPTSIGYTDYWFNGNLGAVLMADLQSPTTTFSAGEGNSGHDATDARYNLRALPNKWRSDHTAPSWRHYDTANYLYVDGHVKSLQAKVVTAVPYNDEAFSLQGWPR